jgi:hypothetical protein
MKRRSKQALQEENPAPVASDGDPLVQIKVWLLGISPMVWRRVLVPADCTLRELHGVFQVAMGVYIVANTGDLINYGERYRAGERRSSCLAESAVNAVISKRFAKRHQMQWTKRGAHLLLQMRTRALDSSRAGIRAWQTTLHPAIRSTLRPENTPHVVVLSHRFLRREPRPSLSDLEATTFLGQTIQVWFRSKKASGATWHTAKTGVASSSACADL